MCKVLFTIIFVIILIETKANELNEIELNLDQFKEDKYGDKNYFYDDKVYAIANNAPLKIILMQSKSTTIDHFICWSHQFSFEIGTYAGEYVSDSYKYYGYRLYVYELQISAVTEEMVGTWKCQIKEYYYYYYAWKIIYKDIYFTVRLMNNEPPQMVLVNGVALETKIKSSQYFIAEYKYSEHDMVNVLCISRYDQYTVQMNYQNSDVSRIISDEASGYASGLRMTLLARHNNTRLACTLSSGPYMLEVLFLLQEASSGIMDVEINNQRLKGGQLKNNKVYYNYFYTKNAKPTSIVVDTIKENVMLEPLCDYCYLNGLKIEQLNSVSKIIWTAKSANSITNSPKALETIVIGLTPLNFKDEDVLSINLPIENIFKEEYVINNKQNGILTDKVKWIYYNFKDGDILSINCSTTATSSELNFNGSATSQNYYNQTITLRLSHDNTVFTCTNTEKHQDRRIHVLGRINVFFHMSMSNEIDIIWLMAVGSLMVIVVVFVCFGVYRSRKRQQHDPLQDSVTTIQNNAETSIPPYPAQWESHYANIKNNINNTNKNTNEQTEELYATIQPSGDEKYSEIENIYTNDMALKTYADNYANLSACEVTENTSPEHLNLQYANPKDFDFVFRKKNGKKPPNDTSEYSQVSFKNMASNDNDDYVNIINK